MINLTRILDYTLVYLLVAFSGIPFFYRSRIEVLIACLIIPLSVFIYRKRKVDKAIVYYMLFALVVQLGQTLTFYDLPLNTFIGLHIRILFAYLVIRAVGAKLVEDYIKIIVVSIWISLFFYAFSYISSFEQVIVNVSSVFKHPFLKEGFYRVPDNIIVYTINTVGEGLINLKRNSGPFWEPAAFAGFITIALLFNIIKTGSLFNRTNNWLMIGIVSTFSTTGLIVLCYIMIGYSMLQRNALKRFVMVPLLVVGGIYLFVNVGFLGEKVISKMSFTSQTYNTRFKSAQLDLDAFISSPVVGVGRSDTMRFQDSEDNRQRHRNNGVTDFLAVYGLPLFLMYFAWMYRGFYSYCRVHQFNQYYSWMALGAVFLIGFSEIYFTKVFFIALTMLPMIYGQELFQGKEEHR
ncbi:MAG: hypothetical protein N4A71_10340 [Carboxylicivirga sp.]|nr:hypothetical protein [Carboxylicivirga sp.]